MSIESQITTLHDVLPDDVELVAVSKTYPASAVMEAYRCGQRVFGESRPQELCAKQRELPDDIEWHMIGHLQTNKVRSIVPFTALIHSVDSVRLLETIDNEAARIGRVVDVLLEVFVAQEETKHGFSEQELIEYLDSGHYRDLKNVSVRGLMCIASLTDNVAQVEAEFQYVKRLHSRLRADYFDDRFSVISMGMSGDYELAIECGSNMIRIGSMIFGKR